jgi:stress-induced-phosphoprotein 1
VKGYIHKSLVLYSMRDYVEAFEAIQEAKEHDTDHNHRTEIQQQEQKCHQALFSQRATETQEETLERAMRDPEVAVSIYQIRLSFVKRVEIAFLKSLS